MDLIHEDEKNSWKVVLDNLLNNDTRQKPVHINCRIRSKEGNYHFLEFDTLVENKQEEGRHILFFARDLTSREEGERLFMNKHLELSEAKEKLFKTNQQLTSRNIKLEKQNHELEKTYENLITSEEIFRQVAENTDDIFWLRDEKQILYVNSRFEKVWGRKKEELLQDPSLLIKWIHPDDRNSVDNWIDLEKLPDDSPYTEQYRIVRPDGETRWLWSRMFAVKDKLGRKYRLVGIASDITEQKEYEDALMIAKEKAQESDMLKSSFLANISHEIRTPMNGIIGFAELISRQDIEHDTRQTYVGIMKKSSEQLIRIIDDIIDFAKLEANQIRIEKANFNLNKTLDQLFTMYSNQLVNLEKDSVTLLYKKDFPEQDSMVISDEQRVRQVFSHLLDNACKYTHEGYIEFGYALKGDMIEFYVKDSGMGIPENKLEMVFEQFRQGDEGHTRKFGGTGLGLPIAKALVNLLGGSIRLESACDQGTTFFFTIPYEVEVRSEQVDEHLIPEDANFDWTDKLILVAEDDDMNFEYMKILLDGTNAKVIRAKDGSQALKICSNLNFDVILMDIRLPVMNGIQATKSLREMGIKSPIIAQTAFAMDDDERKCLEAGCNSYLTKPITKEKLFRVISSYM